MPRIQVREATASDIPHLVDMDHEVETHHIWQLDWAGEPRLGGMFRPVALPRPVRLAYPYPPPALHTSWLQRPGILVAQHEDTLVGYAAFIQGPDTRSAWLRDLVVDLPWRGQGIAKALLWMCLQWAALRDYERLTLIVPFRNDPAIRLAQRLGFSFAGFHYAHFPNGDTALFFQRAIKG